MGLTHDMYLASGRVGAALALAVVTFAVAADGAPVPEAPSSDSAVERIREVMARALDHDPARAAAARLEVEHQALRAGSAVPAPVLEWQSEGLDGDFGREANAADSLRLRSSIAAGWGAPGRALRSQAERTLTASLRSSHLEIAAGAGRLWLELAAAQAQEEIARYRLEHLDRALTLHRKRLELGEVAGAEVAQLELQRATESLALRGREVERDTLARILESRAGAVPAPRPGDLAELAGGLAATTEPSGTGGAPPASSPYLHTAEQRRLLEHRRADQLRSSAWGLPEVEVEVQRIPALDFVPSFETFGFRIAVPLPVGGHGRALRAEAAAAADAADVEARLTAAELRRRSDVALLAIDSARRVLDELEGLEADLPRTEHSLAEQFRLGAVSYLIYTDGLARLDLLRGQLVETRLELLRARLELAALLDDDTLFPLPIRFEEPAS